MLRTVSIMKKYINFILLALLIVVSHQPVSALDNDALYQWTTADGTPTYSPDPPPPGIEFVVVGADLKPLSIQAPEPATTAAVIPSTPGAAAVITPVQKSIPKWKPVRYAQAPVSRPVSQDPQVQLRQQPASPTPAKVVSTRSASAECQLLKRDTRISENFFSDSTTATEMDQVILRLHKISQSYRDRCS